MNSYLVLPKDRYKFYNYMKSLNYKDKYFSTEYMLNSKYPFYINILTKEITVIESITTLACASQCGKIIDTLEFNKIML